MAGRKRTPAAWALLFAKGMAMGLGDAVPGVSGGTIAVIARVYDELIAALRAMDRDTLRLAVQGTRDPGAARAAWQRVDGGFLLVLASGIMLGLLVSAQAILYLLAAHYSLLMGFFSGLLLYSCWYLHGQLPAGGGNYAAMAAGAAWVLLVVSLPPAGNADSLVWLFCCGAVAVSAMLLPGLSGAFVLILLGAYDTALRALAEWDWEVLLALGSGCGVGLLSFARLLDWLLRHYHRLCYSAITGMLAASLYPLWPWREPVGASHLGGSPLWPGDYERLTGASPDMAAVALAVGAGMALMPALRRGFGRAGW